MVEGIAEWAIFGVVLAALPIVVKAIAYGYAPEATISRQVLFGQGELLALAIGLGTNALKDVLFADNLGRLFVLAASFFSLVAIVGGGLVYALEHYAEALGNPRNFEVVMVVSLVLYPGALLVNGASTAKREAAR